jgi:hypothetical protein
LTIPPPEVLFNRYFQERFRPPVRPEDPDPRIYRGKQDLDKVADPVLRSLLLRIQQSFNAALANEKQNVAGHVNHPPFYLDYIDSSVPNALAFRYEAQDHYSFIGITIPLINLLWDLCVRLSRSEAIQILIRLSLKIDEYDALQIVLFLAMSSFIVSHEYTHHVHGHLSGGGADAALFNEILDDGDPGSLEDQAVEVDADGYAAYHVLANIIDGTARSAVELLKIGAEPANAQDEVLLSCFVIAVGGYLFTRPARALDSVNVYRFSHPPQAARMNCLMQEAMAWCRQNRPGLETWMTLNRFQTLMNASAAAVLGADGSAIWDAQSAFLVSEHGVEYFRQLDKRLKALTASL